MNEIQLYDIYNYYYTPFWQMSWFKFVCGSLLLGLLIALVFLFIKKKKRKKLSPFEMASHQLEKLSFSLEGGQQFYYALNGILKKYLIEQFNYPIAAKTDREFLELLEKRGISSDDLKEIEHLFLGAEAIKFAAQKAILATMRQDKARAANLLKKMSVNLGLDT